MRCPLCHGEFRPEGVSCPDCGVSLEPAEPALDGSDRTVVDTSVVVLRTTDPSVLALAKARLEGAGIRFAVMNERMIGLYPSVFGGPAIDSKYRDAEVEVLSSSLESARAVLDDLDGLVAEDRSAARSARDGLNASPEGAGRDPVQ
jgi:hypothetical protein